MADVKWIKIATDIFDDEKILLIESLPEADAIIVIWFKLLCLAGKMNNSGVFMMTDKIAYTDKMLSTIFRRKESTVSLALKTFEQFGMIEIIDDVITIPNWGKHQSLEQIEERKKYQREYQREYRKKQKELADNKQFRKHLCKDDVNSLEEEVEEEKEEDKNRLDKNRYQLIADMYNEICISFPKLKILSDSRKKALKARLKTYSEDDFRKVFEMAEASDFLKGKNNKDWSATFDWMIKDANMAKILDGNYGGSSSGSSINNNQNKAAELDDFYRRAAEWGEDNE